MSAASLTSDAAEIRQALALLCMQGEVYELRALNTTRGIVSGYYTNLDTLALDAASCSDKLEPAGVYLTANPVQPELFSRANNRLKNYAKHTAGDADITRCSWLLLDFDPVRAAGISSTDAEHQAALERTRQVREHLAASGWPAPIFASSGNGGHLLYRINLANDERARDLLKRCLDALAARFNDKAVVVDKTTFNAARIWKVYGTLARKGDSMPDRPHRRAQILEAPKTLAVVSPELLEELAACAPDPQHQKFSENKKNGTAPFNLDSFLAQHNIAVKRIDPYQGGRRLILDACVFDASHSGTSVAIIERADGLLGYSCLHNGCADRHWADIREHYDPSYRRRGAEQQGGKHEPQGKGCRIVQPHVRRGGRPRTSEW